MPPILSLTRTPLIDLPATRPSTQPSTDSAARLADQPLPAPLSGDPIQQAQEVFQGVFDARIWGVLGLRILLIALVVVATMLILSTGRRLILNLQEARSIPDSVVLPIRRTLRWTILLLAFILALQLAGFSMSTIWAAIGGILALLGVAFIAVWSVLSNIACSLMLMIFKPFRIGDVVEIVDDPGGSNVGGRVIDVTLMYVILREDGDEGSPAFIQVPNNLFFQKVIRRRTGRRTVTIEQHVEKHGLIGREQPPPEA